MMDKRTLLLDLAKRRQITRWEPYGCISDYHQGVYECDAVSPYSKTAGHTDARIFVMLQDWISHDRLVGPLDHDAARLGYIPSLLTNRNLKRLLREAFNLQLEDVYGTNLFPFIKPGGMSAPIPAKDLVRAAHEFGLPQIQIVAPTLVICLGLATFNALRVACGETRCQRLLQAIGSPFAFGTARIWCQAHTGSWGQKNRGGFWQSGSIKGTMANMPPFEGMFHKRRRDEALLGDADGREVDGPWRRDLQQEVDSRAARNNTPDAVYCRRPVRRVRTTRA